jgi:hypothetical protein
MNRRKLFTFIGGAAASAAVLGATAPPSQAFFPLLFRFLLGQAVREQLRNRSSGRKKKKVSSSKNKLRTHRVKKASRVMKKRY